MFDYDIGCADICIPLVMYNEVFLFNIYATTTKYLQPIITTFEYKST